MGVTQNGGGEFGEGDAAGRENGENSQGLFEELGGAFDAVATEEAEGLELIESDEECRFFADGESGIGEERIPRSHFVEALGAFVDYGAGQLFDGLSEAFAKSALSEVLFEDFQWNGNRSAEGGSAPQETVECVAFSRFAGRQCQIPNERFSRFKAETETLEEADQFGTPEDVAKAIRSHGSGAGGMAGGWSVSSRVLLRPFQTQREAWTASMPGRAESW